jgi:hypothetical protein
MVNALLTAKGSGIRAVVLIHGYGSSGVGGGIRAGVRSKLREADLRGLVRDFCGGEGWSARGGDFVNACGQLKGWNAQINGNPGVTVVLLR